MTIFNSHDHRTYTKLEIEIDNGECINVGYCNQENNRIPIYNLTKLEELDLNPFENFEEIIKRYGFNLALVLLAIETTKFTAFVLMIMMTGLQQGAKEVNAQLVSTISCNVVNVYRKINLRADLFASAQVEQTN